MNGKTPAMPSKMDTKSSDQIFVKFMTWIFCPIAAAIYFMQIDGAFLKSISYVVDSAILERDLLLIPSSNFGGWGEHYVYRIIAGTISIVIATFVCSGLVRNSGKAAGFVGGLTISLVQAMPIFILKYTGGNLDAGFLVITAIVGLTAPIIGTFIGSSSQEINDTHTNGIFGLPRFHLLWLWIPAWHYGLILLTPITNYLKISFEYGPRSFAPILGMLPVVLYGAPLVIGLGIMSGHMLVGVRSWLRQLVGSAIIIGGIVAIYFFQYWISQ